MVFFLKHKKNLQKSLNGFSEVTVDKYCNLSNNLDGNFLAHTQIISLSLIVFLTYITIDR